MEGYVAPLRVFLLDDHDIVRRGLHDLLDINRDITVVGDSGSAQQAPRKILELRPDVMVLDVQLQDGSGVQVCREVRSSDPTIRGLLLTSYEDEEALVATILAGADGYVLKLAGSLQIVDAIRRVGTGRPLVDAAEAERVAAQLREGVKEVRPPLTEAEERLVGHALDGLTNREIAERLDLTEAAAGAELAALLDRLAPPSYGRRPAPGAATPGKHRSHDTLG